MRATFGLGKIIRAILCCSWHAAAAAAAINTASTITSGVCDWAQFWTNSLTVHSNSSFHLHSGEFPQGSLKQEFFAGSLQRNFSQTPRIPPWLGPKRILSGSLRRQFSQTQSENFPWLTQTRNFARLTPTTIFPAGRAWPSFDKMVDSPHG